MDEHDFGTFDRAFRRVSGAFRVKATGSDLSDLARTYFRVLERHRLDAVLEAGKRCLERHRHFPKAAEWLEAVEPDRPRGSGDARQMTATEVADLTRAEARHYRDDPCDCDACQLAGVDSRPLRFVPTLVDGVADRAFHPRRQLVEVVGQWIHGEALARWYTAQAGFYAEARRVTARYPRLLRLVDRDPGEEG